MNLGIFNHGTIQYCFHAHAIGKVFRNGFCHVWGKLYNAVIVGYKVTYCFRHCYTFGNTSYTECKVICRIFSNGFCHKQIDLFILAVRIGTGRTYGIIIGTCHRITIAFRQSFDKYREFLFCIAYHIRISNRNGIGIICICILFWSVAVLITDRLVVMVCFH